MDENKTLKSEVSEKNEVGDKNFVAFIAIAFSAASVILALCNVEYFSVIFGIIAVAISIIFLVKKLGIKWFGLGALLLGIVGIALGIPRTVLYMSAQFGWSGETSVEVQDLDENANAARIEEAAAKRDACLEEAGIDPEAHISDLAEEQQEAFVQCTK